MNNYQNQNYNPNFSQSQRPNTGTGYNQSFGAGGYQGGDRYGGGGYNNQGGGPGGYNDNQYLDYQRDGGQGYNNYGNQGYNNQRPPMGGQNNQYQSQSNFNRNSNTMTAPQNMYQRPGSQMSMGGDPYGNQNQYQNNQMNRNGSRDNFYQGSQFGSQPDLNRAPMNYSQRGFGGQNQYNDRSQDHMSQGSYGQTQFGYGQGGFQDRNRNQGAMQNQQRLQEQQMLQQLMNEISSNILQKTQGQNVYIHFMDFICHEERVFNEWELQYVLMLRNPQEADLIMRQIGNGPDGHKRLRIQELFKSLQNAQLKDLNLAQFKKNFYKEKLKQYPVAILEEIATKMQENLQGQDKRFQTVFDFIVQNARDPFFLSFDDLKHYLSDIGVEENQDVLTEFVKFNNKQEGVTKIQFVEAMNYVHRDEDHKLVNDIKIKTSDNFHRSTTSNMFSKMMDQTVKSKEKKQQRALQRDQSRQNLEKKKELMKITDYLKEQYPEGNFEEYVKEIEKVDEETQIHYIDRSELNVRLTQEPKISLSSEAASRIMDEFKVHESSPDKIDAAKFIEHLKKASKEEISEEKEQDEESSDEVDDTEAKTKAIQLSILQLKKYCIFFQRDILKVFKKFDKHDNQFISMKAFEKALKILKVSVTQSMIDAIFSFIPLNEKSEGNFMEFYSFFFEQANEKKVDFNNKDIFDVIKRLKVIMESQMRGGESIAKFLEVQNEINIGSDTLVDKLKLKGKLQQLGLDIQGTEALLEACKGEEKEESESEQEQDKKGKSKGKDSKKVKMEKVDLLKLVEFMGFQQEELPPSQNSNSLKLFCFLLQLQQNTPNQLQKMFFQMGGKYIDNQSDDAFVMERDFFNVMDQLNLQNEFQRVISSVYNTISQIMEQYRLGRDFNFGQFIKQLNTEYFNHINMQIFYMKVHEYIMVNNIQDFKTFMAPYTDTKDASTESTISYQSMKSLFKKIGLLSKNDASKNTIPELESIVKPPTVFQTLKCYKDQTQPRTLLFEQMEDHYDYYTVTLMDYIDNLIINTLKVQCDMGGYSSIKDAIANESLNYQNQIQKQRPKRKGGLGQIEHRQDSHRQQDFGFNANKKALDEKKHEFTINSIEMKQILYNMQIPYGQEVINLFCQQFEYQHKGVLSLTLFYQKYQEYHQEQEVQNDLILKCIQRIQRHIINQIERVKHHDHDISFEGKFPTESYYVEDNFTDTLTQEPFNIQLMKLPLRIDQITNSISQRRPISYQEFYDGCLDYSSQRRHMVSIFKRIKHYMEERGMDMKTTIQTEKGASLNLKYHTLSKNDLYNIFEAYIQIGIQPDELDEFYTALEKDDSDQVQCLNFIEQYEHVTKFNAQTADTGENETKSFSEILQTIGESLVKFRIKDLGQLLAGYDFDDDKKIEKRNFYQALMCMKFEDIEKQEILVLMYHFQVEDDPDKINIERFAEEVNQYVYDQNYFVELKSLVNQVVNERIVESSKDNSRKKQEDSLTAPERYSQTLFDFQCGLLLEITTCKNKIAEVLNEEELQSGLIQENNFIEIFNRGGAKADFVDLQKIYSYMLQKQEIRNDAESNVLEIKKFENFLKEDVKGRNVLEANHVIVGEICNALVTTRTPYEDIFRSYLDKDQFGDFIYEIQVNLFIDVLTSKVASANLTENKQAILTKSYELSNGSIDLGKFFQDLEHAQFSNSHKMRLIRSKEDKTLSNTQNTLNSNTEDPNAKHDDRQQNRRKTLTEAELKEEQDRQAVEKLNVLKSKTDKNTYFSPEDYAAEDGGLGAEIDLNDYEEKLESIMIATRSQGMSVEAYFNSYCTDPEHEENNFIDQGQFVKAIMQLKLKNFTQRSAEKLFKDINAEDDNYNSNVLHLMKIGNTVYYNTDRTITFVEDEVLKKIYQFLVDSDRLKQLREILSFMNTDRDSTTSTATFKQLFLYKLELNKLVKQEEFDLFLQRYIINVTRDKKIMFFGKFLKDIEWLHLDVPIQDQWKALIAEDIYKMVRYHKHQKISVYFKKFLEQNGSSEYSDTITQAQFVSALEMLEVTDYHDINNLERFFEEVGKKVFSKNQGGYDSNNQQMLSNEVSTRDLYSSIEFLCQKPDRQLFQDILDTLYIECKRQGLTIMMKQIFKSLDHDRDGMISIEDFCEQLTVKLSLYDNCNQLDLKYLTIKYRDDKTNADYRISYEKDANLLEDEKLGDEIQFQEFYQDMDNIETMGLGGGVNFLKVKKSDIEEAMHRSKTGTKKQQDEQLIPQESKDLFARAKKFFMETKQDAHLLQYFAKRDGAKTGYLAKSEIVGVFENFDYKINKSYVKGGREILNQGPSSMSYGDAEKPAFKVNKKKDKALFQMLHFNKNKEYCYLEIIEYIFGNARMVAFQQSNQLGHVFMPWKEDNKGDMGQGDENTITIYMKYDLEVYYNRLIEYAHQQSGGDLQLHAKEIMDILIKSKIQMQNKDVKIIKNYCRTAENPQTYMINFKTLLQDFQVNPKLSEILQQIKSDLDNHRIDLNQELKKHSYDFKEFQNMLKTIRFDFQGIQNREKNPIIKKLFDAMTEGQGTLQKTKFMQLIDQ